MIGKTISHYKILEKLGEGGMGVVYKAQDTKLERAVAIKFLPQHLTTESVEKERFVHEAKAASALSHTNVTTIHEIDEFEGQTFIVMEYCEGQTLRKIVEKETLSIRKVLDIAVQICEGLTIAHEKGIVHRDIKSDNIMLTPRGQVKIMDFGLAKLKGATKLTQSRTTLGTASYMSPEQAQREEVDHRSDIFSFGVVLYELLTGQLPFQGDHEAAVLHAIISEEPLPVARFNNKVSAKLQDVVDKALAKEKGERYQHIDDVLADLRREKKSLEYVKTTQIPPDAIPAKPKKTLLPFIVPGSIIFVLVLLFLILKPFQVQIVPEKRAVAEENTLAIMYFENLKDKEDEERIGEMVSELLITGLSESQYMTVVSSQRLYDLLKMMGREGARVIDKTVASEVAQKAEAKYMILGKILTTTPDLVITSQLVDVETGNVVASQRIAGPNGTDMFSLVDSLSSEIRKDLEIPALAQREEEKPVADITTHSPDALRLYLEGNELYRKLYMKEAARKFEEAVQIDTTFASGYLKLALCYSNLQDLPKARATVEKAAKFSDRVSKKEKFLIDAFHQLFQSKFREAEETLTEMVKLYPEEKIAYRNLGLVNRLMRNYEESIVAYNRVIQLDSQDKEAYNSLAYTYDAAGRYDEAVQSINKYIQLAPGEANPYDTRGDIYAHHAEVDKALESYREALEIKPDFEASIEKLGRMYLFKREYDIAERYFLQYGEIGGKAAKSISRFDLALIPMSQGKYDLALNVLRQGIAADELDKLDFPQFEKHRYAGLIYLEKKEYESALRSAEQVVELMAKAFPENIHVAKSLQGYILIRGGKIEEAEKIANEVSELVRDKTEAEKYLWSLLELLIKFNRGEVDQALKEAQVLAERQRDDFLIRFWLAKIYLEKGMIGEAVQEFQELSNWNILSTVKNPILSLKVAFLLALAYEKSGWDKRAIEKYEEILEIWKDADPWVPEVEDARQKLAQLKKKA